MKKLSYFFVVFVSLLFIIPTAKADESSIYNFWSTPGAVHIENSQELQRYIGENQFENSKIVTHMLKTDYLNTFSEEINVTDLSMSIEIVGHIYPDQLANYLPQKLKEKIKKHTVVIDSGESTVDSDRWVWDSIAKVISIIKVESNTRNFQYINHIYNLTEYEKKIYKQIQNDMEHGTVPPSLSSIL